jgi:hypothetical protein
MGRSSGSPQTGGQPVATRNPVATKRGHPYRVLAPIRVAVDDRPLLAAAAAACLPSGQEPDDEGIEITCPASGFRISTFSSTIEAGGP